MTDFIVHRLRSKPVEYTVTISHFVRAGQWVMGVRVNDLADDRENCLRVVGQWSGVDPAPSFPLTGVLPGTE